MEPAKLKVTELRDELSARGLSTKGLKAELVARLEEYIAANGEAIPETNTATEETPAVIEPEKPTSPRKTRSSPQKVVEEPEKVEETITEEQPKSPTKGKRGRPSKSEPESEPETKKPATVAEIEQVPVSVVEEVHAEANVSAAKNTPSTVLHITNLHRPFTERQLKEFIGSGYVAFWLEDVKSQCLAQFSSIEEAESRRAILVGQVFPPGSGHVIEVDFGSESRLSELLKPSDVTEVSNSSSTLASLFKKTSVEPAIYYLPKN